MTRQKPREVSVDPKTQLLRDALALLAEGITQGSTLNIHHGVDRTQLLLTRAWRMGVHPMQSQLTPSSGDRLSDDHDVIEDFERQAAQEGFDARVAELVGLAQRHLMHSEFPRAQRYRKILDWAEKAEAFERTSPQMQRQHRCCSTCGEVRGFGTIQNGRITLPPKPGPDMELFTLAHYRWFCSGECHEKHTPTATEVVAEAVARDELRTLAKQIRDMSRLFE